MSRCFHQTILVGFLGSDPELRANPNGSSVTNFRIGITETWKGRDGERQSLTEWYSCSAWGPVGEIVAKYAKKGAHVQVIGRMRTRTWEDKNGGGKRFSTSLLVDTFNILDQFHASRGGGPNDRAASESRFEGLTPPPPGADDDLPF